VELQLHLFFTSVLDRGAIVGFMSLSFYAPVKSP